MKRFKVNIMEEFDEIQVGLLAGYYEYRLLFKNAIVYKQKFLKGLFNKYHFIADMDELGMPRLITNQILEIFK